MLTHRSALLFATVALSLAACAPDARDEAAAETEEQSEIMLRDVLENGGVMLAFIATDEELLACEPSRMCAERELFGRCQLGDEAVFFSCEEPRFEREISECGEDADCGDAEGARCELSAAGFGVCLEVCGGVDQLECGESDMCVKPIDMLSEPSALGVCHPRPAPLDPICPMNMALVCGDDGETYQNACRAQVAGAEVVHPGECAEETETARPRFSRATRRVPAGRVDQVGASIPSFAQPL